MQQELFARIMTEDKVKRLKTKDSGCELAAFLTAFFVYIYEFIFLFRSGLTDAFNVLLSGALVVCFYLFLFILQEYRSSGRFTSYEGFQRNLLPALLACCYCGICLRCFQLTYISGNIFQLYFSGAISLDQLFHTSIAESYRNFGYPSILCGEMPFFHYHTGFHLLIAGLSCLFQISCLAALNYSFPLIFFPLFIYFVLKLVREIRIFHGCSAKLSYFDFIIIFLLLSGPILISDSNRSGFFINSIFISESMLIGMTFLFIFLQLFFRAMNRGFFTNNLFRHLFLFVLFPVVLFLLTFVKISIGYAVLFAGIFGLCFQERHSRRFWLEILFVLEQLLVFYLSCRLLCEQRYYVNQDIVGRIYFWHFFQAWVKTPLFFLIATGPLLIFLAMRWTTWQDLFRKGKVLEKTLLFSTIMIYVPVSIWEIPDGSAFYFIAIPYLVAGVFLCGYNMPEKLNYSACASSPVIKCLWVFVFVYLLGASFLNNNILSQLTQALDFRARNNVQKEADCKFIMINNKKIPLSFSVLFSEYRLLQTPLYKTMTRLREHTAVHAKNTVGYLSPDSCFLMDNPRKNVFLIQAFLGIPVLNSCYSERNRLLGYRKDKNSKVSIVPIGRTDEILRYGLDNPPIKHGTGKSLKAAQDWAKNNGYSYLITFGKEITLQKLQSDQENIPMNFNNTSI